MAGQQNIFENNQETLFNKHNKMLMNQVDLWYINDKFSVKTEYNESTAMYNYLMTELYKSDDCEVIKFLNKKLRGALGDENIKIVNLHNMETQYPDINNYYYTAANYEEVQF